jgi:hypothetical protein
VSAWSLELLGLIFAVSTLTVGWCVSLTWTVLHTSKDVKQLVRDSGIVEENTRAIKALTHFVRWLAKHQTGEDPPPPVD